MSRKLLSALVAGTMTAAMLSTIAAPASAEPNFTPDADDIVGVGSDTSMFTMQAIADVYNAQTPAPARRLVSFDAQIGDVTPTIVLRQGLDPITRPNGSGNGKTALRNNLDISYARSSSALNAAEVEAGLRLYPFAVDGMKLAVRAAGTNAPAQISQADLVRIYKGEVTNWNQIGGQNGTIKPLVPQSGSGTYQFFVAQLTAANNSVPVNLTVWDEVQEHDPIPIAADPNAVAPFSTGRAKSAPTISLTGGWQAQRALYNVLRQADVDKPELLALFGEDGFLCSAEAFEAIESTGMEQLASTDAGGVCGEATQAATTNFLTAEAPAVDTTTSLTGSSPAANRVNLRATVAAGTAAADGTVAFFQGATKVGEGELDSGAATLALSNVPAGSRTYRAVYTPADADRFNSSESQTITVAVKAPAAPAAATAVAVKAGKVVAGKKGKVTVTVTARGTSAKPTGTVRVFQGKKRIAQRALKSGKAVVTLPKLKPGKVKLRFAYVGNARFKASAKTVTIRVARAR